ncbi:hypothetical protein SPHINGO8AM_200097 [Sphingomonas sp. 8AM]|nr:hypothetical protein SPHINGO8AM_200097 [Sphingomonas sp. 8AM]
MKNANDRRCERSEASQGILIRLWVALLRSQ